MSDNNSTNRLPTTTECEPVRPVGPYIRFSRDVFKAVQLDHPDLRVPQLGPIIGRLWRALPDNEKSVYTDAFKLENDRYRVALKAYRSSVKYIQEIPEPIDNRNREPQTASNFPHERWIFPESPQDSHVEQPTIPSLIVCCCTQSFGVSTIDGGETSALRGFLNHRAAQLVVAYGEKRRRPHYAAMVMLPCVICNDAVDINQYRDHLRYTHGEEELLKAIAAHRQTASDFATQTFECDECLQQGDFHRLDVSAMLEHVHPNSSAFELYLTCRHCTSEVPLCDAVGHAAYMHCDIMNPRVKPDGLSDLYVNYPFPAMSFPDPPSTKRHKATDAAVYSQDRDPLYANERVGTAFATAELTEKSSAELLSLLGPSVFGQTKSPALRRGGTTAELTDTIPAAASYYTGEDESAAEQHSPDPWRTVQRRRKSVSGRRHVSGGDDLAEQRVETLFRPAAASTATPHTEQRRAQFPTLRRSADSLGLRLGYKCNACGEVFDNRQMQIECQLQHKSAALEGFGPGFRAGYARQPR